MACDKCSKTRFGCGGQGCVNAGPLPSNAPPGAWVPFGAPPGAWTHVSPDGMVSCGWPVTPAEKADAARQKLEAMTGQPFTVSPRTGGIFDGLTAKAGDAAGTRIMRELGTFALLTSPAWILLLLLPKRET